MKTCANIFPNLLHIYAVDIAEKTFPIEIYWTSENDYGGAWLVNPIGIKELNGRHEKYMQVHGVSYKDFESFGKSPQVFCEMLNKSFADGKVYVADEELEKTNIYLKELYSVAGMRPSDFTLNSLYDFLIQKIQSSAILEGLKEKVGQKYISDGAAKFCYLKDLTKLALNKSDFEK